MLTITVSNTGEGPVTVDGLGVLSPGENRVVDEAALKAFEQIRGLSIVRARMPEGVTVSVEAEGGKDE